MKGVIGMERALGSKKGSSDGALTFFALGLFECINNDRNDHKKIYHTYKKNVSNQIIH